MSEGHNESYIGLLSFLSFSFSVLAAVVAIDMYALLRTGQFARTWRVLIIASVMFALMQALRMSELLNFAGMRSYHLSEVVELMFVMSLAYAFYLQRALFGGARELFSGVPKQNATIEEIDDPNGAQIDDPDAGEEWARLSGDYGGGPPKTPVI